MAGLFGASRGRIIKEVIVVEVSGLTCPKFSPRPFISFQTRPEVFGARVRGGNCERVAHWGLACVRWGRTETPKAETGRGRLDEPSKKHSLE